MLQLDSYGRVLRNRSFLRFWSGFTISSIGDSLTRVALTWFVFQQTRSAWALALLTIAYTAPILLAGFFAGPLLDRFSARRVMILDNLLRGAVFALIPALHALNRLQIWHIYVVAAIYGGLMMISLAGAPTLIPSILNQDELTTANAMETLSYTLSGVIGPPLAGVLIAWIGSANVVTLDALSYFIFAVALLSLGAPGHPAPESGETRTDYSIRDAIRLMTDNKVIFSTTVMFMAFNIGLGALVVFLPLLSDHIAPGRPEVFGILLGSMSLGEVLSAWLAGSLILNLTLGKRIILAQILSGLSLLLLLLAPSAFWPPAIGLFLLGLFSAPLTIWAQTLRMQVIPPEMRGRTFAVLRTLMQGATPLGGALAGLLLPLLGTQLMIVLSSILVGGPGLAGLRSDALKRAGGD